MTTLAVVTFDLHSADSEDYQCVKTKLARLGFKDKLKSKSGREVRLPENTFAAKFPERGKEMSAPSIASLVHGCFAECNIKGKVFAALGRHDNWAWSSRGR